MAAAISSLVASPLADEYDFEVVRTYIGPGRLERLKVFARSLLRLGRWCRGEGVRLVHIHMAARGSMYRKAVVVPLAKALRRPVLLHVHAGPGDLDAFFDRLGPLRIGALRRSLALADTIVAVSGASAEVLRRRLVDAEITVVPNAPPPLVEIRPPRGDGPVLALFLGGFANPAKGGAALFEALPALVGAAPDLEVVMAGPGEPPGPLPVGCEWRGWLEADGRRLAFEEADLFVMPSLSEGMPIALLEAMSNRIAVVATKVGGIPEILDDGVDALLVDPGRPDQLVEAISLLAGDEDRRAELSAAGAARMERLASDDVYGQLRQIYVRLASR
ncbi:MAG: glycosyltransferase family 4 protein [Solirubrobacterales bacterium]